MSSPVTLAPSHQTDGLYVSSATPPTHLGPVKTVQGFSRHLFANLPIASPPRTKPVYLEATRQARNFVLCTISETDESQS